MKSSPLTDEASAGELAYGGLGVAAVRQMSEQERTWNAQMIMHETPGRKGEGSWIAKQLSTRSAWPWVPAREGQPADECFDAGARNLVNASVLPCKRAGARPAKTKVPHQPAGRLYCTSLLAVAPEHLKRGVAVSSFKLSAGLARDYRGHQTLRSLVIAAFVSKSLGSICTGGVMSGSFSASHILSASQLHLSFKTRGQTL